MNQEINRLNSFATWPLTEPIDPIRAVKGGFFYTGHGTEVECFSCGGKISDWNYGDQVMWRHMRLDRNCAFVTNPLLSGNVPLIVSRECHSVQSNEERPQSENEQGNPHLSIEDDFNEVDEMYKSDALRLLSYVNWRDTSLSREELVNAGFYHAGEGRIRCAWCRGEIGPVRNLGAVGTPLQIHRTYFPSCVHAMSLEEERLSQFSPSVSPRSFTPPLRSPPAANNPQSSGAIHNTRVIEAGGEWRSLGVVGSGAKHPSRASLTARLATFMCWPADRVQAPKTLADAGFYYTGVDDQVRCFYCDGGLGKWEVDDVPWSEHAHWFPHCGYVVLVKGQEFVDSCRNKTSVQRTLPADRGLSSRTRNSSMYFPVIFTQVDQCMESTAALSALEAGLDVARVRRAIGRRLRATGLPFNSSESLIDAVLNEQLNEEAWSVSPHSQRLARDILAESLRDFAPRSGIIPGNVESEELDSQTPQRDRAITATVNIPTTSNTAAETNPEVSSKPSDKEKTPEKKQLTLEEENRQLKEARMCKVCMDNEVNVVFLPCGHLVSCAGCGAALRACPLCRAPVKALVRAYLA